jgi:hypothetical protein
MDERLRAAVDRAFQLLEQTRDIGNRSPEGTDFDEDRLTAWRCHMPAPEPVPERRDTPPAPALADWHPVIRAEVEAAKRFVLDVVAGVIAEERAELEAMVKREIAAAIASVRTELATRRARDAGTLVDLPKKVV